MDPNPKQTFITSLEELCEKYSVSIFFGDRPATIFMDGEPIGLLSDTVENAGSSFEIMEPKS